MKRFVLGLTLGLFGWLATSSAQAQGVDEFGAYGPRSNRGESPQIGLFEARFGAYNPRVDSSVPNGTPYADSFGNSTRYMLGLEGDLQLVRIPHLGTLGPGLGWGYTRSSGYARLTSDKDKLSDETTSLTIMPIYLVAVLRADVLAREFGVPLVPYAKLGMGSALWWSSDGGETAHAGDVKGTGISFGPQYALGGMFLLDVLDRQTARDADVSLGINNSYLFGEWYVSDLDAFGSTKRMNVGANTWVVGLAIEF
ncbi:MAG TPA: MXAN_2562 family outer membrane beta-barrel protein [Polyangiaceae bacterium]|nr:MXAN_2562 family outer membrane beta-barrel protein [Polyangiaceae bacterium]